MGKKEPTTATEIMAQAARTSEVVNEVNQIRESAAAARACLRKAGFSEAHLLTACACVIGEHYGRGSVLLCDHPQVSLLSKTQLLKQLTSIYDTMTAYYTAAKQRKPKP